MTSVRGFQRDGTPNLYIQHACEPASQRQSSLIRPLAVGCEVFAGHSKSTSRPVTPLRPIGDALFASPAWPSSFTCVACRPRVTKSSPREPRALSLSRERRILSGQVTPSRGSCGLRLTELWCVLGSTTTCSCTIMCTWMRVQQRKTGADDLRGLC